MRDHNEVHVHIHEGVSPEAAKAAVEALHVGGGELSLVESGESNGQLASEPDEAALTNFVKRAYTESEGKAKPLLELLAAHPEQLVPFTKVSEALGFETARSLPGLLGAFGRRANHRYEGNWPFEAVSEHNQWHLRMSQANADTINALR